MLPTALVIIAILNLAKGDENAFTDRLISHMNLDGSTASLVHELFGTTANNLVAASVTIVIGFLLWGLSIGQRYQDVYARAWRIHAGTAAEPLWIGPTLDQNGKAFGSFGVVIALFAYILIVVTISMVCAVFGPVWAEWRQGENDRKG